jgi:UDP-2-acetamido-2,6-beta-L-arabino-hexul-4-ose reductase
MNILVTGSKGFIGRNLIAELKNRGFTNIFEISRESDKSLLNKYAKECDFIFHLAGVNRPINDSEFIKGNLDFTAELLTALEKHNNKSPILFTSSIHALQDSNYGRSKRAAEDLLFSYKEKINAQVLVYRLSNVFGKWCKPNYNSVVATFCHNIARGLEIKINNPDSVLALSYIDEVIDEFVRAIDGEGTKDGLFYKVPSVYSISLGELSEKLYAFHNNRNSLVMPSLESDLDKALYATYLSYLEDNDFSYKLNKRTDNRGWLAEFIKSEGMGQIFISKSKPGVIRGNHWHHTKVEKFLVIQGQAIIKFKKIDLDEIIEYKVNGEIPEVVDIPAGYAHSIENIGEDDLITLFWASEIFDPERPDTYFLEV